MPSPAKAVKDYERIIAAVQRRRKSRIFGVIHTAYPQHICDPEFATVFRNRDRFRDDETLEILIHSPGGHAIQAYRLARQFRARCKRLHVLIPRIAKSAATILSLNADAIFMGEFAELGPIDNQIQDEFEKGQEFFAPLDEFKSVEFLREHAADLLDYLTLILSQRGMSVKNSLHEAMHGVTGLLGPLYGHIDASRLGSYRQVLAESEEYARRLLSDRMGKEEAAELARKLVWDYPAHDFVIDRREARNIGLPVQRLPIADEKALISAISELSENDLSYLGFIKDGTKNRSKPKKAKARLRKGPTPIKAPPRQAVGG